MRRYSICPYLSGLSSSNLKKLNKRIGFFGGVEGGPRRRAGENASGNGTGMVMSGVTIKGVVSKFPLVLVENMPVLATS